MGLREKDIETFDDHEGIYLFLSSSSLEEEKEDNDCFVKTIEFVCADFLYVCERGDGIMLALFLSLTY